MSLFSYVIKRMLLNAAENIIAKNKAQQEEKLHQDRVKNSIVTEAREIK